RSLWAGDGFSVTSISASASNRDLVSRFAEDDMRDLEENVENRYINLRNVNYASFSQAFKLEFGLDVQHRRSTVGLVRDDYVDPTGAPQAGFDVDRSLDDTGIGAFVSTVTRPLPQLQATLGLRVDGATLNEQVYLSPRIALAYDLTSRLQLSASVGDFRQSVPLYFTSQNAGNTSLDQMRARHAIAGISYLLTPDTRLSVEVYDKQYTDMPQIASTNTLADPTFVLDGRGDFSGALTSDGEATARGFDILLQKKMAQNLYGLASVSFFRAQYTDPSGQERPRTFDTQTLFTVIGGYKPNDKWEVSARWSYSGGRPVTPLDPIASAAQGDEVFDVSQFHGERLPAYHSLFLRVDRRYNFAQTNLVAFFSLWNAYNRANVEERFWNATDERIDDANLFSLLPVAGVVFEF
ncbi:MAG: TonB-dependent receptor, partial [Bacteroidota bacterium]